MTKKYLYIIPLFLLEVMIQLGFFWLAPTCECRWVVYSFLTVMTIAHLMITFVLITRYGVRKCASTIVAGSFIQTIIIVATVFLLIANVTVRSSLFLMLMLMALYVAVVTIMWIAIEGIGEGHNQVQNIEQNDYENDNDSYHESDCGEYVEETHQGLNLTPVRERNYNKNSVNEFSGRGSARRTPPPIPVKH